MGMLGASEKNGKHFAFIIQASGNIVNKKFVPVSAFLVFIVYLSYFISISRGLSSSRGEGEPFFFRWRTHSVSRYSI